jgi:hypothetical protein
MALDTPEEINQYLILEKKTTNDLRALCEGMQLPPDGERRDLISRLMSTKIQPQTDFLSPQMIALRTKVRGVEIPGADEFMKRVRKVIFDGKTNKMPFSVLNGKNEKYLISMKYAKCSAESLKFILESGMIYPHASQRELVKMIQREPLIFSFNLVQRSYSQDKTFIMLHVQPKEA